MTLVINISTSFQFELAKYIALPFLRMYTIKCNRRSSNFFFIKKKLFQDVLHYCLLFSCYHDRATSGGKHD